MGLAASSFSAEGVLGGNSGAREGPYRNLDTDLYRIGVGEMWDSSTSVVGPRTHYQRLVTGRIGGFAVSAVSEDCSGRLKVPRKSQPIPDSAP